MRIGFELSFYRFCPFLFCRFDEFVEENIPIVRQIQDFAAKNNVNLEQGWKVELAKQAKTALIKNKDPLNKNTDILEIWEQLFLKIQIED
ncbi:hypothetical protein CEN44_17720 [Fischerella muscicola CCMEE 5323]|uniref:Uncharacterized protein n=1 Tax=Fischerella muscicola CCMEE 5323 TaxID=2019572 RepID=A0A2N6K0A9_FISMU|nr:hypothetical protein [Fischerella muscicola]PLZ87384.1 hypothetical protein CEN44_17720 [Fischerella muscicola CCMEE 5323]